MILKNIHTDKTKHHKTKPEDRLSFWQKTGYASGMAPYALMVQGMNQLCNPIFNDCLGVDPRWISWVMGGSRLWDAITDPIMGIVTDNTNSRWGRRRPWIALGAVLCALSFAAIWLFPRGMSQMFYFSWFLVSSLVFYVAFTIFSVPYIALGMELSPDYHERTSVQAFRTVLSQVGVLFVSGLFWFTSMSRFSDRAEGMRYGGMILGVVILFGMLIPAIFSGEHPSFLAKQAKDRLNNKPKISLLKSAKETLSQVPFLILIGVTVLMTLGLLMVASLGYYVAIYHVFGGDKTEVSGRVITIGQWMAQLCTIFSVPIILKFSKTIGKKSMLYITIGIAIIGSLLKWVCYTPSNPWLLLIPGMVMSGGLASTWMLINAMIPDVVDLDELKTGERREGMFSAVYSWTYKSGVALALVIAGYVLSGSGFDATLGAHQDPQAIFRIRLFFCGIPVVTMGLAAVLLFFYSISEKRSYEIQSKLKVVREERAIAEAVS
jgi:glycoside/pentoside/hexuronide:cation symporter, GPH family